MALWSGPRIIQILPPSLQRLAFHKAFFRWLLLRLLILQFVPAALSSGDHLLILINNLLKP